MASLQGYRIQALNIAVSLHKGGYDIDNDLLKLAEKVYGFITKDMKPPAGMTLFTMCGKQFRINSDGTVDEITTTTGGS
jgi:hypothetical protein